jgi:hypothetical protein
MDGASVTFVQQRRRSRHHAPLDQALKFIAVEGFFWINA